MPSPAPDIPTTWSREQVERMLEEEKFRYQRIALPYGLSTPGDDRTPTFNRIFPQGLAGRSLLDVGCYFGFFCFEALRRGAASATGVEVDPEHLRKAKRLADCLGLRPEFRCLDIEREPLEGTFDDVICLNVMHHFKNPLTVLEKLGSATRGRLILELVGFGKHDRGKLGLNWLDAQVLNRYPVLVAGQTGTGGPYYSPKFIFSPAAIENILLYHRNQFARVDRLPADFKDRYTLVAHKRHFRKLVVLAGPAGVGKSTLIDRLRAGEAPQLAAHLQLARFPGWQACEAKRLQRITEPEVGLLIYHYNFLSPYTRSTKLYERDELLDVMALADELEIVTLWADADTLRRQLTTAKLAGRGDGGHPKHHKFLEEIADPAKLVEYYRRWFEYAEPRGRNTVIAADGVNYRTMTIAQWRQQVGA